MRSKQIKDRGWLHVMIAISCLILFFIGFNMIYGLDYPEQTPGAKKQAAEEDGGGRIVEETFEEEAVMIFDQSNTEATELVTDEENVATIESVEVDNFFLKVILWSNPYLEQVYERTNGKIKDKSLLFGMVRQMFKYGNTKDYVMTQVPAIIDITNANETMDVFAGDSKGGDVESEDAEAIDSSSEDELSTEETTEDSQADYELPPLVDGYDVFETGGIEGEVLEIGEYIPLTPTGNEGEDDISEDYIKQADIPLDRIRSKIEMPKTVTFNKSKPYILLYHTHASESYLPMEKDNFHVQDRHYNVLSVGEIIAKRLMDYGHKIQHDDTYHDIPSYNDSYKKSLSAIERNLKSEPNFKFLIDVHRDGTSTSGSYYEKVKAQSTITVNEKKVATFSLVVGPANKNREELIKFAHYIKEVANTMYPGLCTQVIIKPYGKYNQYLSDYATLLEVGSNINTIEEAQRGAKLIAEVLNQVIEGISE